MIMSSCISLGHKCVPNFYCTSLSLLSLFANFCHLFSHRMCCRWKAVTQVVVAQELRHQPHSNPKQWMMSSKFSSELEVCTNKLYTIFVINFKARDYLEKCLGQNYYLSETDTWDGSVRQIIKFSGEKKNQQQRDLLISVIPHHTIYFNTWHSFTPRVILMRRKTNFRKKET